MFYFCVVANYILFTNVTNKSGTSVLLSISSSFQGYFWQKSSTTQMELVANAFSVLSIEFSVADSTYSLHNWLIGEFVKALDYVDSQTYVLPQLPVVSGVQAYIKDIL